MNIQKKNLYVEAEFITYLAGFIDADGSIFAQLIKNENYKHKFQVRVTIQITQLTERNWFLNKILSIIGSGQIKKRKEKEKKAKLSDYILTDIKAVHFLLKKIRPFLMLKQKQADLIIQIIERLPSSKDSQDNFIEICKMVDHVAKLNDKTQKNNLETVLAKLNGNVNVIVPVETSDKNKDGSSQ